MAEIIAWTTAELDFVLRDEAGQVPEGIFDGIQDVVVTLAQSSARVEKHLADVGLDPESATIHVRFAQQETGKLQGGTRKSPKQADTQVNLYYGNESRNATYESTVDVMRNLHPRRLP